MLKQTSCAEIIGPWMVTFAVFSVTVAVNVVLGTFIGTVLGWLFSVTFMGGWINEGLKAFGVSAVPGGLPKIGAAAGFLSGFFKYRPSSAPAASSLYCPFELPFTGVNITTDVQEIISLDCGSATINFGALTPRVLRSPPILTVPVPLMPMGATTSQSKEMTPIPPWTKLPITPLISPIRPTGTRLPTLIQAMPIPSPVPA